MLAARPATVGRTDGAKVHGERIVRVETESGQAAANPQVIDGSSKTLLPGLWDMHQPFFPDLAMFDIASRITTARDLASSIDELSKLKKNVPSGMIAEQFVRDGADEIQHMNFIMLNFMPDVTETRARRFTEPGKRAAGLDLNSSQATQFISLLNEHHTVIDPNRGDLGGDLQRPAG